jgi:plastocyanin
MKKLATLLVLALASAALVSCGDDDDSATTTNEEAPAGATAEAGGTGGEKGGEGGSASVAFEADPGGDLAYTTTEASTEAGEVTIDFKNPQGLSHDVAIEDSGGETVGKTEVIGEGETSEKVNLKAGAYTFYCSVPGHREAGMEGTLTVK